VRSISARPTTRMLDDDEVRMRRTRYVQNGAMTLTEP
jgi:hypothetical protein